MKIASSISNVVFWLFFFAFVFAILEFVFVFVFALPFVILLSSDHTISASLDAQTSLPHQRFVLRLSRWLALITRREFVLMGLADCMGKFNQRGRRAFSLSQWEHQQPFKMQMCLACEEVSDWNPIDDRSRNAYYKYTASIKEASANKVHRDNSM